MTESDRNNLSRIQRLSPLLPLLGLLAILFCFFVSLELMGTSMKLLGEGFAEQLIQTTSNPFIALFIGILATSLVQSSSTVTSLAVSAVAGGGLTVAGAIPIVLGANVGTSVTNTIVSLGHIGRKDEFGRAMGAATVHDFFNLLAVAIFFPLELFFGFLSKSSAALATGVTGVGGTELFDFVDVMTGPVVSGLVALMLDSGVLVLILGVLLLFFSLRYLVVLLRKLFLGRSERLINKYLFGPAPIALVFGTLVTIMVQSSSITTSITVPLVGAGIVTVSQIFPFVLGANIGTTVTALLASLVLASGGSVLGAAALQVALAHLIFNCCGVITFLPLRMIRRIPVSMSELLGVLVVKNRAWAFGYVACIFFLVPLVIILLTRSLGF
ncbi:MAG: Na/Pi symporter [Bacteroidetes bacterium]|nr:Na/Pi symporter [Bacteroidota bacterium]MXW82294.1 Na/Pi cotransporter family protein [Rhodothermaceae bacterium]MDE2671593.1 Na/Pi symporter [Bacteroidota bacterium]MXX59869.1 Na/Pi cotransporter family protein [Rhodothermaceae bacterium]MYD18980.1 Na/Pi cotransporter family protein [Rhodothermaceae bacterium]